MGFLGAIFGSNKKTTTTATTTNATQTTIDNNGGVYATGSTLDLSSYTDSSATDNSITDNRDFSVTTVIDPSAEIMAEVAAYANSQNMRLLDSVEALNATGYEAFNASLTAGQGFFDKSLALVDRNTNAAIGAVVAANRSDGAQVLATVENMTKYIILGVAALGAFAALRGI